MKPWPSMKLHLVPLHRPSRMIALHTCTRRLHTHPSPLASSSPLPVDHLPLVPLLALGRILVWSLTCNIVYRVRAGTRMYRHTHLCGLLKRHQQFLYLEYGVQGCRLGKACVVGDVHRHGVFPMMHLNRCSWQVPPCPHPISVDCFILIIG